MYIRFEESLDQLVTKGENVEVLWELKIFPTH